MAYVPDEAVKCGKELSFPARALYQLICAYRNATTGECYLKDQKRMSEESGISYCHLSTIKRELLTKGWVKYSENGLLVPIKGTFIKPKSRVENKDVATVEDETFIIRNSFISSKIEAAQLSYNESPSFILSNGTEIADSKEFLYTNTSLPIEREGERERARAQDLENPPWESNGNGHDRSDELPTVFSDAVSYWFKTCVAKRDDRDYPHKARLPSSPTILACDMIDSRVQDLPIWKQVVNEWDNSQYQMQNLGKLLERYDEILFKRSKGIGVSNDPEDARERRRKLIAERVARNSLPDNRKGPAVLRDVSASRRATNGDS